MNVGEFLEEKHTIPCEKCERFTDCCRFQRHTGTNHCGFLRKIDRSFNINTVMVLLGEKMTSPFNWAHSSYLKKDAGVQFADEINKELKP